MSDGMTREQFNAIEASMERIAADVQARTGVRTSVHYDAMSQVFHFEFRNRHARYSVTLEAAEGLIEEVITAQAVRAVTDAPERDDAAMLRDALNAAMGDESEDGE
jgi:hypothetical protein